MSRRTDKIAHSLQRAVSEVINSELTDPRLGFLTVTETSVSPDMQTATFYISVLGNESQTGESMKALRNASGYIRQRIGSRLSMKYVPVLRFQLDDTEDRAERIEKIIDGLELEDESPDAE